MLRKILNIFLIIAVYALGVFSGVAILLYPAFGGRGTARAKNDCPATKDALKFASDKGSLTIHKDIIPEASSGVVEVEFKKGGNVVKKGTDEIVGVLSAK